MDMRDIKYVLINNKNYEFLDEEGYTTKKFQSAKLFNNYDSAEEEVGILDEPEDYDIVRAFISYDLEKVV